MNKPLHVKDAEFEEKVLRSAVPVLVDFWAPWCQPCRFIAPILDNYAAEYGDQLTIAKVNVDENSAWADKYGVQSIPTFLFVRNGEIKEIVAGIISIVELRKKIAALLQDGENAGPALK